MSKYKFDHFHHNMTKLYKVTLMSDLHVPEKVRAWLSVVTGIITPDILSDHFGIRPLSAINYLSRLEHEGMLKRIARGEYILRANKAILPDLQEDLISIHNSIKERLPYLSFVTWSIMSFKHLFHDIPVKDTIFIEAKEKDDLHAIKEILYDSGKDVTVDPARRNTPIFPINGRIP